MRNCEKTEICHFVHFLLLRPCHKCILQPTHWANISHLTFRAVCVPEEMIIWMHAQAREFDWQITMHARTQFTQKLKDTLKLYIGGATYTVDD